MNDLGEASKILGMNITRDRSKRLLTLDQGTYMEKVLRRFNMMDCKPSSTPLDAGTQLSSKDSPMTDAEKEDMEVIPYASVVGSLMYAMVCTRPDHIV